MEQAQLDKLVGMLEKDELVQASDYIRHLYLEGKQKGMEAKQKIPIPPVDPSARVLASGAPIPEDSSHTRLRSDGQQEGYVVLTVEERSKGFARPYRESYRHLKCGKITTMGRSIAETFARSPFFYSGTFCCNCGAHLPIGENGEFVWYEMDGSTGPKVGT